MVVCRDVGDEGDCTGLGCGLPLPLLPVRIVDVEEEGLCEVRRQVWEEEEGGIPICDNGDVDDVDEVGDAEIDPCGTAIGGVDD